MKNWSVKQYLLTGLGLLLVSTLIGLGSWWFLANYERKTVTLRIGESIEAKNNPLLAADYYLATDGHPTRSYQGRDLLFDLPPAGDVVLISTLASAVDEDLAERLYAWVESGGHLILPSGSGSNGLLGLLDIELWQRYSDCGCDEEENDDQEDDETEPVLPEQEDDEAVDEDADDLGIVEIERVVAARHNGIPFQVAISADTLLLDPLNRADWRIDARQIEVRSKDLEGEVVKTATEQGQGAWLLHYAIGAGTLTVVAETRPFTNKEIGKEDHAYLLSLLAEPGAKVWLLYSGTMESLTTILRRRFPYLLLSLAGLLLLWLWRVQERIGLPRALATDQRRNVLLHIDGIAQFCWQLDKAAGLVEENRRAMMQRLSHGPGRPSSPSETQALPMERLVRQTGLAEKMLVDALERPVKTEQDLMRSTKALQRLAAALDGPRRSKDHGTDA